MLVLDQERGAGGAERRARVALGRPTAFIQSDATGRQRRDPRPPVFRWFKQLSAHASRISVLFRPF